MANVTHVGLQIVVISGITPVIFFRKCLFDATSGGALLLMPTCQMECARYALAKATIKSTLTFFLSHI